MLESKIVRDGRVFRFSVIPVSGMKVGIKLETSFLHTETDGLASLCGRSQ